MANLNKKPGQGKTPQQYEDSSRFAWYSVVGMIILLILMSLMSSCTGVYYLTDAEYSDAREEHTNVVYYNSKIYSGWASGSYYYYGMPHYYPWYYYYDSCPPSHYSHTTHVIIRNPIIRPNKPKVNTHRPNIRVKTNTNRNNKVIINKNNGFKRTNKTTIRRKPKK